MRHKTIIYGGFAAIGSLGVQILQGEAISVMEDTLKHVRRRGVRSKSRGTRRGTRTIALAALVGAGRLTLATAQTSVWTGAGIDDNWSTGENWLGGVPPGNPTTETVVFASADSGNRSIVDADWTIGELLYSEIVHTMDLAGNTLQVASNVAVASGYLPKHSATVTWTNGGVTVGSAEGRGAWLIGANSGSVALTGMQALAGVTTTGLVALVNIGFQTTAGGTANGTLDVRNGARLALGSENNRPQISLGYAGADGNGAAASGTLNATNGNVELCAADIYLGRRHGNYSANAVGILNWNQAAPIAAHNIYVAYGPDTRGQILVPVGGVLTLGSDSEPVTNLWIGSLTNNFNTYSASGTLDAERAAVSGYVLDLRVGCKTSGGSSKALGIMKSGPGGTLTIGNALTPAFAQIGYSDSTSASSASGTNILNGGTWRVIGGELAVGRKDGNNSSGVYGTFLLTNDFTLSVGTPANPSAFQIGYNRNALQQGTVSGVVLAGGGGTLTANLTEWNVGYRVVDNLTPVTEGKALLAGLSRFDVAATAVRVGVGRAARGLMALGPGRMLVNDLTINDGKAGSEAKLETTDTQILAQQALSVGAYGSVTVHVSRAESGLTLANPADDALRVDWQSTIDAGRGLTLVFHSPLGGGGTYYGLKWAGNHVDQIKALLGADGQNGTLDGDRLRWDDTTYLSSPGLVDIVFDGANTYVGFCVNQGAMLVVK